MKLQRKRLDPEYRDPKESWHEKMIEDYLRLNPVTPDEAYEFKPPTESYRMDIMYVGNGAEEKKEGS